MKSISVLLFLWHEEGNKNKNTATKISVWASCQLAVSKASVRVFRLGAPLFLIYSLYFLMYNSSQCASSVSFLLRRKKTRKKQCDPMLNKVKIPASAAAKERPRTKSKSAGGGENNRDRLRDTARDKTACGSGSAGTLRRPLTCTLLPPRALPMSLMVPARRLHVTAEGGKKSRVGRERERED